LGILQNSEKLEIKSVFRTILIYLSYKKMNLKEPTE